MHALELHTLAVPKSRLRTVAENGKTQESSKLVPVISDSKPHQDRHLHMPLAEFTHASDIVTYVFVLHNARYANFCPSLNMTESFHVQI